MKIWEVNAENFGEELRELRLDARLTQQQLADKMYRVSINGIKNWEQGVALPNLASLLELAQILRVDEIRIDSSSRRGWYR